MRELRGCPGAEHFCWWLRAWAPDATDDLRDEAGEHVELAAKATIGSLFPGFDTVAATGSAVRRLVGWRTSRFGHQVVTYEAVDGSRYDLIADINPDTGMLAHPTSMRSVGGTDLEVRDLADLDGVETGRLHRLFESAYRGADHGFLDRRLASLTTVCVAWADTTPVGFCATTGIDAADLPCVGRRTFTDGGITCIDPAAQRTGLGLAFGRQLSRTWDGDWPEITVNHFATPVSFHALLRVRSWAWPGNDIRQVTVALATPTHSQRLVGAAFAERGGATAYQADRWVIRTGQPAGETTTVATGLDPLYTQLFNRVDRAKGETLLGTFWADQPPAAWHR